MGMATAMEGNVPIAHRTSDNGDVSLVKAPRHFAECVVENNTNTILSTGYNIGTQTTMQRTGSAI
jgi:hypothetical protein